ncbi:MAG: acyl-CoA dehydrogenase family protein [Solirubrobacterales bacterium]|nr:acyl-CoA dehydrogenase family protein [Solirubrobacterales bacterium]
MGLGLRAVATVAGSPVLDRLGMRRPVERLVYRATRDGARTATTAARAFTAARRLAAPARQRKVRSAGLFDLTPTDEQAMLQEAFGAFGRTALRPAASAADAACAAPPELLALAQELGASMLGVPEELGGAMEERSAVTTVLVAEQLAAGDPGLAVAVLAPAAVSGALSLWGDADQQARYLPPFAEDDPPAAALAILEPQPLFDPYTLQATATPSGDGFVLRGEKALVPRAADAELLLVAADVAGDGPALFLVEAGAEGLATTPEPAMGLRAAATARVHLHDVAVPASARLAPGAYADVVRRARLAWCAIAVGGAQAVLDYVIPYVNERRAFGEPIANRQAVAFAVADISIELEGMRLATLRAAARADQGKDFAREVAIARRLCTEHGTAIGSQGVQLLGGHGYVKEHPVERWYRDLRTTGVAEGALLA